MRSFRKLLYAASLGMTFFAVQPTSAAAEEAHGSFTLAHEVHWQKVVLRPGKYTFDIRSFGPSDILTVRSVDKAKPDAVMLVDTVDVPKAAEASRLVLVSRSGQSFVSAMDLPAHEIALRFAVPSERSPKQFAH